LDNLIRGLDGIDISAERMAADLDENWAVLGEAIQQAMRAAALAGATGMANPYERLKELTRGQEVGETQMRDFIATLGLPPEVERRLLVLSPATYIGLSERLATWE
ncbi:MAG: adenylosuccinate lyase, partial [Actinomycetaceae bacterium]|nr:adenylosuccinate lyase [Actinomycetaceae bacterium]